MLKANRLLAWVSGLQTTPGWNAISCEESFPSGDSAAVRAANAVTVTVDAGPVRRKASVAQAMVASTMKTAIITDHHLLRDRDRMTNAGYFALMPFTQTSRYRTKTNRLMIKSRPTP